MPRAAVSPAVSIFKHLTAVPTAPFYEDAVAARCLGWIRRHLGRRVAVRRHRGGLVVRYVGAGAGPALALAAHIDHPGFHLSSVTRSGAEAKLQGGLPRELLPGAAVEAFPARPRGNRPAARGTLGEPQGTVYPVAWSDPPRRAITPEFAVLDLIPFSIRRGWLASRSIDDLLGAAVSLEALRRVARSGLRTNLTVLLHRAEEVGFIGALELIRAGAVSFQDSVLSVETSREIPEARPGRGPVIRTGDRTCWFDPNLLALLDAAAARLKGSGRVQRARLTGGSCEATAYQAFGYESAGVAIPLVNYHNGGRSRVEPEKVRVEDVEATVRLLVEAARRFPGTALRGSLRAGLEARRRQYAPILG